MKSVKGITYIFFSLAFISICMCQKVNVVSHNVTPRVDSDEKLITCVTEYIIKGDLGIDDGGFCDSSINSLPPTESCNNGGSEKPEGPTPGNYCDNYYDITLVVENSSFVQKDYWMKGTIPFLESMARNARVSKDKAHMSIILFAGTQNLIVPFTDEISQDKEKLIEKIRTLDDAGTDSNTLYVYALEYAFEKVIFGEGTRSDAPKIAVLFYYGFDYGANKSLIPDVVEDYKQSNIKLIIVGIGLTLRENALLLADCKSEGDCQNAIFQPWDFVIPAAEQVKEKICNKNNPSSLTSERKTTIKN
ncbi:von Willebrand factor A domain-related protein [Plasmodium berghei]|uniref:von Willebrand factor A domain-related protein n=2 Tax=Plasmodium berghei TaxID=5821 RepID=A0A509AUQ1_PLABA|nr:von Willebrand factor A domain-related protein [Plasmodium berghei ANKA]AAK83296.1 micronemal protein WARP [Plasmodium berghei]AAO92597.1 von Willerbrand factor A domain-related ookinete/early oocyst protein [Plasmodium berghei]CXI79721.1 von Willebrand factor A domain-related protein [Plasmodium berghei]SCM25323.1 von Willebrand factor A domain-related protein [Plasmodium berghei]SCN27333.1 von Willebrand factor A domain-related protein [Plasmodium berghei]|eukprot:XP_034422967.1 von Willebrand factor A domain-related protein [Plasmodium berghei ANKA]